MQRIQRLFLFRKDEHGLNPLHSHVSLLLFIVFLLTTSFIPQSFEPKATVSPITPDIEARILGHSYPADGSARIPLSELRYLRIPYRDLEGNSCMGEMIVNRAIAADVVEIFAELYAIGYPIERMQLIDDFSADDELSMRANNTSAFCYRVVKGSTKLSAHARGMAVDINPLYNPCFTPNPSGQPLYKPGTLQPSTAAPYTDRRASFPYKLTTAAVQAFKRHGFLWGGDWRTKKDYQHFER